MGYLYVENEGQAGMRNAEMAPNSLVALVAHCRIEYRARSEKLELPCVPHALTHDWQTIRWLTVIMLPHDFMRIGDGDVVRATFRKHCSF